MWIRRSAPHIAHTKPAPSLQREHRLGLTSGQLCWRPALRRPASMSEPRSCRPPWALLSYYSRSSGCSRGCQTSKRTFPPSLFLPLSLSPICVSILLSLAPSFSLSFSPSPGLPFSCDCLIALSPEQSGAVYFTWCLDARVPLKVNKRCDMQKGKKGSCQHPGQQQRLMSATPRE